MSLGSALNAAVSGLRTTQAGINVVSQNVANAGSVGYTRRTMSPVQMLSGDNTTGVRTGAVQRTLDLVAQRQLRIETSAAGYTDLRAGYAAALERLFGKPGAAGSLDGAVNDYTRALQGLASNPNDAATRSAVVDRARLLASALGGAAEGVQALRSDAEGRIGAIVTRADTLLQGIQAVNARVVSSQGTAADPGLLDERDRLVGELSALMDLQVSVDANNSMRLSTTGGQTLFDGSTAVRLSFDARGDIGPGDVYEPGAGRGVGTIFAQTSIGSRVDLIERGAFRSGEIRAAIEMRDDVLVQAQRQLDELAAGLAVAGSQTRVDAARTGTGALRIDPAAPATNDVLSVGYVSGGVRRDVTVVIRNGGALDPALAAAADPSRGIYILDLGDPASRLALETALGLPVTHGPGGSWIQVGSAESLSLSRPATRSPAAGGAFPLFVDGATRDTVFGGAHPALLEPTGLAQRLAVNPDVVQDPRRLNRRDVPAGDSTRAGELLDNVTKADRAFPPAAGVGGANSTYVAPLSDFARRVVETQGANSEAALRLDEGQKVALAAIESRFSESAGVNIDEEMGRLVQLQTAYGANARVMTAVRDMLDMLMRM